MSTKQNSRSHDLWCKSGNQLKSWVMDTSSVGFALPVGLHVYRLEHDHILSRFLLGKQVIAKLFAFQDIHMPHS